jgi:hypothetical protein
VSLREAVKNGPRMQQARAAHTEAQIRLAETRAKAAHDKAAGLKRRVKGDGPLAKSRKLRADALEAAADRHRAKANQMQADLAKTRAAEAAKHRKHVKRTVASTSASGLVPNDQAHPGRAKPGQAARPIQSPGDADAHRAWANLPATVRSPIDMPLPTKGHPMTGTVSGEAVNIEQTRANLDQLKSQVTDVRGSFEATSGSLASGGLNQLAGSLASADDALDSVLTQIEAAEKHLSDQEAIAEAAQAAGEMHGDKSFYGA